MATSEHRLPGKGEFPPEDIREIIPSSIDTSQNIPWSLISDTVDSSRKAQGHADSIPL